MKIILSRKGFDSATGRFPSPLFPSGEFYSLPIPDNYGPKRYGEISAGSHSLGKVVNDLTGGRVNPTHKAHLDPDLNYHSIPRKKNWRPAFGQSNAAESHLRRMGIGRGDVFLFFGWFKQVVQNADGYRYVKGAPDLHVIFGWLQIESRISAAGKIKPPSWASDHPHYNWVMNNELDALYISTEQLILPGLETDLRGAGTFTTFNESLCLTDQKQSKRSIWRLPQWFYPQGKNSILSYHGRLDRWALDEENVMLRSVGRGQEFVLDCADYPGSVDWLKSILASHNLK